MKTQQWAFVDFENINNLKTIPLEPYDVIYIFVGAKQSNVTIPSVNTDKFTNIRLLKIKETSKNNLDFHLSYYLGKLDSLSKKDISFTVLSNDTGFDHLLAHITRTGRKCSRLGVSSNKPLPAKTITKDTSLDETLQHLLSKDIKKFPKSEVALKNYIKSNLGEKSSDKKMKALYQDIIKNKKIANRIMPLKKQR